MRESRIDKAVRARQVVEVLGRAFPDATTALDFGTPLQLMVAVMLSAQCTDKRVNLVTPTLFARFSTVEDFAQARPAQLHRYLRSCGLFRNKARAIVSACRQIVAQGGAVPVQRVELARLPGIGNKSAGVIAMHLSDDRALPVDTHVARLALRLGFSRQQDPDRIERDLAALLPSDTWKAAHHRLVLHGRNTCTARAPRCQSCPVRELCPRRGVMG